MNQTPVLLLKTRSTPHDGYEELLATSKEFDPIFVPVLEHKFNKDSLERLETLISSGAFSASGAEGSQKTSFGALIFTSQRAVEAFAEIVDRIRAKGFSDNKIAQLLPKTLPLYVVGPATARGLRSIGLECEVVGEESGNGEVLSAFILDHYNKNAQSQQKRPVLFLVGEQRRDIIPKTLQSSNLDPSRQIRVIESTVYETGVMEGFPEHFTTVAGPALAANSPQWVVVFSPTGCRAMLEGLGLLDPATGKARPANPKKATLVATIGPTTRDFLKREFDFQPDVCAAKPSPDGVLDGIASFIASAKS